MKLLVLVLLGVASSVQAASSGSLDPPVSLNAACAKMPPGTAPATSSDTAAAFVKNSVYSKAAQQAKTPAGYTAVFSNLAAVVGNSPLMVRNISSYNPQVCADICKATRGCNSFNIFFVRNPSLSPAVKCPNPSSVTNINCRFYGTPSTKSDATLSSEKRSDFQIVPAGSNAYNLNVASQKSSSSSLVASSKPHSVAVAATSKPVSVSKSKSVQAAITSKPAAAAHPMGFPQANKPSSSVAAPWASTTIAVGNAPHRDVVVTDPCTSSNTSPTFTDDDGQQYNITCDSDYSHEQNLFSVITDSFASCMKYCSDWTSNKANVEPCLGVTYWPDYYSPYYSCYGRNTQGATYSSTGFEVAQLAQPPPPSSPSAPAPTSVSSPPADPCAVGSNAGSAYTDQDGQNYTVTCNADYSEHRDLFSVYLDTFAECVKFCSDYSFQHGAGACLGVTFKPNSPWQSSCWGRNTQGPTDQSSGFQVAQLGSTGQPAPSSTAAAAAVPSPSASSSSTSSSADPCSANAGATPTFTDADGQNYTITCNADYSHNVNLFSVVTDSFASCMKYCSDYNTANGAGACLGVTWWPGYYDPYFSCYGRNTQGATYQASGLDVAQLSG